MVVIPRQQPVLENLNIYYLNVPKLIEHLKGEIGSGGIYFKSHAAEGVIFFDQDELLSGSFHDKEITISGYEAVEHLLNAGDNYNFSVNIYEIGPEEVYYWASIPAAEKIYKDLSTEFTDLEGLIKKMRSEKLTGYIHVAIGSGSENGLIFLLNGKNMGGAYSWSNGAPSLSKKHQDLLIQKTKESGGSFNVCRIPLTDVQTGIKTDIKEPDHMEAILAMLAELMRIFEKIVRSKTNNKIDFQKLLKQKLVDHADRFAFLDPFAGEFEYSEEKIIFSGEADNRQLIDGVVAVVKETAQEIGLLNDLIGQLDSWADQYAEELAKYNVRL